MLIMGNPHLLEGWHMARHAPWIFSSVIISRAGGSGQCWFDLQSRLSQSRRLSCWAKRSISCIGVETLRYAHTVSQPKAGRRA